MPVVMHVAEKPSVARSIAAALCPAGQHPRTVGGGGGGRGRGAAPPRGRGGGRGGAGGGGGRGGFVPGVQEFEGPPPPGLGLPPIVLHVVTSVAGHLMSMDFAPPFT